MHGSFQIVMKFVADQMTAIMEVESDLRQEYSIRRRMLIERAKVIWDLHRFKNEITYAWSTASTSLTGRVSLN